MADLKWPWVSRHRLEHLEKQLESVDKERRELLDRLLGSGPEARQLRETVRRVEGYEDAEIRLEPDQPVSLPEQGDVVQFTTPFDRIEQRFDKARRSGKAIDPRFRARV